MRTQCISAPLEFEAFDGRRAVAGVDGGAVTSDAGALLLREADRTIALIDRGGACFADGRDPADVVHTVRTLVGPRIVAIALGYEDVNDHDRLRFDPVLALFSERLAAKRQDCAPLAGKSTINRLEHAPRGAGDRYHTIGHAPKALADVFVEVFLDAHAKPPREIVIDLDATDAPRMGINRAGSSTAILIAPAICRCTCSAARICWRRRCAGPTSMPRPAPRTKSPASSLISAAAGRACGLWCGPTPALPGKSRWRGAKRTGLIMSLAWPATAGSSTNWRSISHSPKRQARRPVRRFKDFFYTTLDSWSRRRRVSGKAEHPPKGANPRFLVTALKRKHTDAQTLYERVCCARGAMENRIKEQQLDLFADRTSTATMAADQLRLWFSSLAYVLIEPVQRIGLGHTEFATATAGRIRLKLLKIGARVTISVRRIKIAMASACPYQSEFALAHARLRAPPG